MIVVFFLRNPKVQGSKLFPADGELYIYIDIGTSPFAVTTPRNALSTGTQICVYVTSALTRKVHRSTTRSVKKKKKKKLNLKIKRYCRTQSFFFFFFLKIMCDELPLSWWWLGQRVLCPRSAYHTLFQPIPSLLPPSFICHTCARTQTPQQIFELNNKCNPWP